MTWSGCRGSFREGEPLTQTEPIELARYRDPDGGAYVGIGAELRDARLHRGAELADVAAALRIRRQHIEAIEEGRFADLPGRVYAIGFLRAYASHVELDPALVVERFRDETTGLTTRNELHFPEPPPQSWRPQLGMFGVALLLTFVSFGAWYIWQSWNDVPQDMVAEVPEGFAAESGEAVASAPPAVAPGNTADGGADAATAAVIADLASASPDEVAPDPLAAEESLIGPATDSDTAATVAETEPEAEVTPLSEPLLAEAADVAAVDNVGEPGAALTITGALADAPEAPTLIETPPPPPMASGERLPRVYGQGNVGARVVLRATADSWVQIQGTGNDLLLTRIMHPGDTYLVPDGEDVRLTTGNAGGLELLLDGKLLPPLGASGAVQRNIPISVAALAAAAD